LAPGHWTGRGYVYALYSWIAEPKAEYELSLLMGQKSKSFFADTPEDAASSALIWILEREKDG